MRARALRCASLLRRREASVSTSGLSTWHWQKCALTRATGQRDLVPVGTRWYDHLHSRGAKSGVLRSDLARLRQLQEQLRLIAECPVDGVSVVSQCQAVEYCEVEGELQRVKLENRPWEVDVMVSGHGLREDQAYDAVYRVRLRFSPSWPQERPTMRFLDVISHGYLHDDGSLPTELYKRLPDTSVRTCLEAVRFLLSDDVAKVWGGLSDEAEKEFAMKAKINQCRLAVIAHYSQIALFPHFLGPKVSWQSSWASPEFQRACSRGTPEAWHAILEEHVPNEIYSFPLLSEEFCNFLSAEVLNFLSSGLPAAPPNSMNHHGVVLADIGMDGLVSSLQAMLQPLGALLFPGPGSAWDGHHYFIVRYRPTSEAGLDMHVDDSDVTFNVCLGLSFEGAGLRFCGELGAPDHRRQSVMYHHRRGRCVVHRGRWRHGADDITAGERLNLILWNRSSEYRRTEAFHSPSFWREPGPPDLECLSFTHDRDYGVFKAYPAGKEHYAGKGWVPPEAVEYEGFKAEPTSQ